MLGLQVWNHGGSGRQAGVQGGRRECQAIQQQEWAAGLQAESCRRACTAGHNAAGISSRASHTHLGCAGAGSSAAQRKQDAQQQACHGRDTLEGKTREYVDFRSLQQLECVSVAPADSNARRGCMHVEQAAYADADADADGLLVLLRWCAGVAGWVVHLLQACRLDHSQPNSIQMM